MGLLFSSLFYRHIGANPRRLLMLGLDGAGKTTILYKLKEGETVPTAPTIGFNVENVDCANVSFTVWDVGGQEKQRPLWIHYYENTDGLIFVVDSSDRNRMEEARIALHSVLKEELLKKSVVLIFANKHDCPNAMNIAEIAEKLELSTLSHHTWHIQSCCAFTEEGLYEGLAWVSKMLQV